MVCEEFPCIFKSVIDIGDKRWDWCTLLNAEASKLTCRKCGYRRLPEVPKDPRKIAS